jgi:hypothetical protein
MAHTRAYPNGLHSQGDAGGVAAAYAQECLWFRDFSSFFPAAPRPHVDFLTDRSAVIVTNWSSFPYERIAFDGAAPVELLLGRTPGMTQTGAFVRVSFRQKIVEPCGATVEVCSSDDSWGGARTLFAVVDYLDEALPRALRDLAAETGLFVCVGGGESE